MSRFITAGSLKVPSFLSSILGMFNSVPYLTLTVTQSDKGMVTRTNTKETNVKTVAHNPGPSGSAANKMDSIEKWSIFSHLGCLNSRDSWELSIHSAESALESRHLSNRSSHMDGWERCDLYPTELPSFILHIESKVQRNLALMEPNMRICGTLYSAPRLNDPRLIGQFSQLPNWVFHQICSDKRPIRFNGRNMAAKWVAV